MAVEVEMTAQDLRQVFPGDSVSLAVVRGVVTKEWIRVGAFAAGGLISVASFWGWFLRSSATDKSAILKVFVLPVITAVFGALGGAGLASRDRPNRG